MILFCFTMIIVFTIAILYIVGRKSCTIDEARCELYVFSLIVICLCLIGGAIQGYKNEKDAKPQTNDCGFMLDRKLLVCGKTVFVNKSNSDVVTERCYYNGKDFECGDVIFKLLKYKLDDLENSIEINDLD